MCAYVADFGVAKVSAVTKRTFTFKAGTPSFQSPEQLNGTNIGTHCDVYAFGCVLLELFAEKQIWEGLSARSIMFRVGVKGKHPHVTSLIKPGVACQQENSCTTSRLNL